MSFAVLSIDAWRDKAGWNWNDIHRVGEVSYIPDNNRDILKMMRQGLFLPDTSKGKVAIDDDGYNIVIIDKNTYEPLFAIEYGNQLK